LTGIIQNNYVLLGKIHHFKTAELMLLENISVSENVRMST